MLRHGVRRFTQLLASNWTPAVRSSEMVASSMGGVLDSTVGRALVQAAATSMPSTHSRRWMSSDGTPSSSSAGQGSSLPPPSPLPAAQDIDAVLESWGAAMDEGDWNSAWDIFESHFPVDGDEFPPLEELLAFDADAEQKKMRRQREFSLQEETARARVRKVDDQGRSHGVGKRKTSVARVWLRQGPGHVMINRKPFDAYFPSLPRRNDLLAPLFATATLGHFDVMAAVHGGGPTGQAQALRHGIARALQAWDPEMRPVLKEAGLLSRDARVVERKKPGKKKARKSFAWVKR